MQRNFFAAADDLLAVFEIVEQKHHVAYVATGMFSSPGLTQFESGASLPAPESGGESAFLVTPSELAVTVRSVPQRSGGTLYAVDELANPTSATLRLGRACGRDVLLPGVIGTTATAGPAVVIHRAFASAIGKSFKRVQSYWVGPAAHALLEQGVRLTISENAAPEYDLAYGSSRVA
jgi:hypothetical protein